MIKYWEASDGLVFLVATKKIISFSQHPAMHAMERYGLSGLMGAQSVVFCYLKLTEKLVFLINETTLYISTSYKLCIYYIITAFTIC